MGRLSDSLRHAQWREALMMVILTSAVAWTGWLLSGSSAWWAVVLTLGSGIPLLRVALGHDIQTQVVSHDPDAHGVPEFADESHPE